MDIINWFIPLLRGYLLRLTPLSISREVHLDIFVCLSDRPSVRPSVCCNLRAILMKLGIYTFYCRML